MKARVELLVLIALLGLYLGSTLLCNCMRYEGMTNLDTVGQSLRNANLQDSRALYLTENSRTEGMTNMSGSNPFASLKDNKGPKPGGQMLIFGGDKADPSCCPSAYSTSQGCICATEDQMEYLNARGGNRTDCGIY